MRELILKRIEEIAEKEKGFPRSSMRWQNFFVGVHISKVDFKSLDDEELFDTFERLIWRCSKQM